MSAALKFASTKNSAKTTVSEETRPARDPRIQGGWDLAKEFTAAQLTVNSLTPLLRQVKDNSDRFVYPKSEGLPDSPYELAELVRDVLQHTGKDKINCMMWSSYEPLCSKESSAPNWDNELPYPEHKDSPIEFHSVGALGSNETRKIINNIILPDLGLGDFLFRSYPGYEFWNKKKHNPSQRGAFGRLVDPDGSAVPAIRQENGKKVRRYDVSLVRKQHKTHETTQEIKFGSDSD